MFLCTRKMILPWDASWVDLRKTLKGGACCLITLQGGGMIALNKEYIAEPTMRKPEIESRLGAVRIDLDKALKDCPRGLIALQSCAAIASQRAMSTATGVLCDLGMRGLRVVGRGKQRLRHVEAERPGGLEIDDQLKLGW